MPSVLWHCWLGSRKGIRPVKKNGGVLAWLSVWSEMQTCVWPSWCYCHSLSLASVKSRLVLPFWYWLTWVVPEKGLLNGCVCVCYVTKCMVLRCARNCHALGHRGLTSSFFIPLWKRHCFPYVGLLTSVAYHHTTLHCFLLCLCWCFRLSEDPRFCRAEENGRFPRIIPLPVRFPNHQYTWVSFTLSYTDMACHVKFAFC